MERDRKISYAKRYAAELVAEYPEIAGIIFGGSLVRGNDLPISDIDLWCFVDKTPESLPIEKHYVDGVYKRFE